MAPRAQTFGIVTLSTPAIRDYAIATAATKHALCLKQGGAFVHYPDRLDNRPPSWSKVPALINAAGALDVDWLFWLDADAFIADASFPVKSILEDGYDLIIAKDHNGINAGSFLIRNNERSRAFLRRVYAAKQFLHHVWWEQAAMMDLLAKEPELIKVKYVSQQLLNFYYSPSEHVNIRESSLVVHCPGLTSRERRAAISEFLVGVEFTSATQIPSIVENVLGPRRVTVLHVGTPTAWFASLKRALGSCSVTYVGVEAIRRGSTLMFGSEPLFDVVVVRNCGEANRWCLEVAYEYLRPRGIILGSWRRADALVSPSEVSSFFLEKGTDPLFVSEGDRPLWLGVKQFTCFAHPSAV